VFNARDRFAGHDTEESCTTYNYLKILRMLFVWSGDPHHLERSVPCSESREPLRQAGAFLDFIGLAACTPRAAPGASAAKRRTASWKKTARSLLGQFTAC